MPKGINNRFSLLCVQHMRVYVILYGYVKLKQQKEIIVYWKQYLIKPLASLISFYK